MNPDLTGKRLELLKQIAPAVSSVAVLLNPDDPISTLGLSEIELPARKLGVEVHALDVRNTGDLDNALHEAIRARRGALAIMPNPVFVTNLKRIADFAVQNQLPSMFHLREFADAGGLVSYGVDRSDLFRRAAAYVDKILKGASPADLPIEQPTKFELVINLKTAKALGLTVPPSLLGDRRRGDRMTRRKFIAGLGGAVVWPLTARAQQPAMPVIGYISSRSPDASSPWRMPFPTGLGSGRFRGRSECCDRLQIFGWPGKPVAALAADLSDVR